MLRNLLTRKQRQLNPLWVVDLKEDVATRLPEDKPYTVVCFAEDWQPGCIYVPVGAKIVAAETEERAREKVRMIMWPNVPSCNGKVAEVNQ